MMKIFKDILYNNRFFYGAKNKLKDEPEYETKEIVCTSIDNGLKYLIILV